MHQNGMGVAGVYPFPRVAETKTHTVEELARESRPSMSRSNA